MTRGVLAYTVVMQEQSNQGSTNGKARENFCAGGTKRRTRKTGRAAHMVKDEYGVGKKIWGSKRRGIGDAKQITINYLRGRVRLITKWS